MEKHLSVAEIADKYFLCKDCVKGTELKTGSTAVVGHDEGNQIHVVVGTDHISFAPEDFSIFLGLLIRWMV